MLQEGDVGTKEDVLVVDSTCQCTQIITQKFVRLNLRSRLHCHSSQLVYRYLVYFYINLDPT